MASSYWSEACMKMDLAAGALGEFRPFVLHLKVIDEKVASFFWRCERELF